MIDKKGLTAHQVFLRSVIGLLVGITIMMLSLYALGTIKDQSEFCMDKYNQGWTLSCNGKTTKNVDLEDYAFNGVLKKGTEVVLTNTIPENTHKGTTMRLLVYLSTVDVYVDGKSVYTYGQDELESGSLVGSGYHFIDLPDNCAGKEIEIVIHTAEKDAFTNIVSPILLPTSYAYTSFSNTKMPHLFVGVFLFVAGLVISIISGVAVFFDKSYERLFLMGILSLLVGAWSMCNGKVLQIFAVELAHQTAAEYVCLYLAPIPLMLLIIKMNTDNSLMKKIILCFPLVLIAIFDAVASVLHFTNQCHYPMTLKVFHGLCLILVVCAVIGFHKKFSLMDNAEKVLNIAIIELCCVGGLDIVRFNVSKYLFPKNAFLADSILPYGMLIFVLLLLISYFLYLYDVVEERAKSYALSRLAYTDALTGLFNRAKSELIFKELQDKELDYYLINIDVNGLKKINDTFGHAKGDLLIIQFAGILRSSFGGIGNIMRMGGDEFLVVVKDINADQIKPALRRMMELEEIRSKQLGFTVECSFGVATNKENAEYNPEQVYSLADSRMYEMKVKSKKARKK